MGDKTKTPYRANSTNIRIYKSTHKRLVKNGRKGETFDELINRILNYFEDSEYMDGQKDQD